MSRGSPARRATALLAALLLPAGCAAGYGFGAGLVVDTRGELGAVAGARLSFGLLVDDESAVAESLAVDGGGEANFRAGVLAPAVGLDYVDQPAWDGLAWRLGFRGRFDLRLAPGDNAYGLGYGGAFALLAVLDDDGDVYTNLGGELQGYGVMDLEDEARRPYGLFIVSVVWERWAFTELDDFFPSK